jgi:hypothetical protein
MDGFVEKVGPFQEILGAAIAAEKRIVAPLCSSEHRP